MRHLRLVPESDLRNKQNDFTHAWTNDRSLSNASQAAIAQYCLFSHGKTRTVRNLQDLPVREIHSLSIELAFKHSNRII
jgi:hypothetical protein